MAREVQLTQEQPFTTPRREWPWQRVQFLWVLLLLAVVIPLGRNFGFVYGLLPARWQWLLASLLVFFGIFFLVRDKVVFLIGVMILLCTWRQGGFWYHEMQTNLMLLSDFPMLCLLLMLPIHHQSRIKYRWPLYIATAYTFWYLSGLLVAFDHHMVLRAFTEQIRALLIMFVIAKYIQSERQLRAIIGAVLLLLLSQGLLAMYTWKFGAVALFGGFFTGGTGLRTSGSFQHANALGVFLLLTLPLAYRYCALVAHPKMAWFFGVAFLSGLFGLYSTFSRSAWFAMIGAVALMLAYDMIHRRHWHKRYRIFLVLGLLGLGGIMVKYPGLVVQRMSGAGHEFSADNQYSRMWYIMEAVPILISNPILGVGAGNYGKHTEKGTRVHSTYMYIAATTGFPGIAMFLAFMGIMFYSLYLAWWYGPFYIQEVAIGIAVGFLAFMAAAAFAPDYCFYGQIRHNVWILAGIALGMINLVPIPLAQSRKRKRAPMWDIKRRYPRGAPHTIPFDMRKRYPPAGQLPTSPQDPSPQGQG